MKELFKEFLKENNLQDKFIEELELSIKSFFGDDVMLVDEFFEVFLIQVTPSNYVTSSFPFEEVKDRSIDWEDVHFNWIEKLTSELRKQE